LSLVKLAQTEIENSVLESFKIYVCFNKAKNYFLRGSEIKLSTL